MFGIPDRIRKQAGRHAVVDGIHFPMPIHTRGSRAVLAAYTIDPEQAAAMLPGNELHVYRLWGRAVLLVTVIDYHDTDIGQYIEFSVGIACTRGQRPAPRLLPAALQRWYQFGQYVIELPVSTEVSVKGGKGIWGMPKHRAPLDFLHEGRTLSCQYDLDGQLVMRLDVRRPRIRSPLAPAVHAANYCQFRGMLMRSRIVAEGRAHLDPPLLASAHLTLGDHPRADPLRRLDISRRPFMTVWQPEFSGVLDDHLESWFLTHPQVPDAPVEGLESVVSLGQSQEWPPPPDRTGWRPPW